MNKVFRVIWNAASGRWVVTSELAKSHSKSSKSASLLAAVALPIGTLLSSGAMAVVYTPGSANNEGQAIIVDGGTSSLDGSVNFTGSVGPNVKGYELLGGYDAGYITGAVDPNALQSITTGTQSSGVSVIDAYLQAPVIINTYDNANITQVDPGAGVLWNVYSPSDPSASNFYDAQIAKITGGGTFNMNADGQLGDKNTKNTVFVEVTDGTANWNSSNTVQFSNDKLKASDLQPKDFDVTTQSYAGTFVVTLSDGSQVSKTVSNIGELVAYNSWLVDQLEAGKLGDTKAEMQQSYDDAFAQAYTDTTNTFTINQTTGPIPLDDPLFTPLGQQIALMANGANAVGHISSTGELISDGTTKAAGIMVYATNGGTVINDGTISTTRNGVGVVATADGHFINNGVRNVGKISGTNATAASDLVNDNSTYVNNGTFNSSTWSVDSPATQDVIGVQVSENSQFTNNGAMNIGVLAQTSSGKPTGATVSSGSTFTNAAGGLMYLGREASTDTSSAPIARGGADVAQTNGIIGIDAQDDSTVVNDGSLIIGDVVQGGVGINVQGANANITNNGNIQVKGHYSETPTANIGILNTSPTATVTNNGTIDLSGVNSVGIRTQGGSKVTSAGDINVLTGVDPTSGVHNFGIWATGVGSSATLTGKVNLTGDGAIGVHVREGATADVSGSGQVTFADGSDQIGFFVYGPGSSVTNDSTVVENVTTTNSTLYRLEDGADFNGTGITGTDSVLTASGQNSTALWLTGKTGNDVSAFNSGGMTINVTGADATGVRIAGGAQGKTTVDSIINLDAVGAIAAMADGQKLTLEGTPTGASVPGSFGDTTLDAGADGFGTGTLLLTESHLTSSLDGVTGYIAKNGAALRNSGNIEFTGKNTTGIEVLEGSTGGNTGSITVQDGGVGLLAASSGATTTLNNKGDLVLKGGSNANRTTGISATGSGVKINMDAGTIDLQGQGAVGVAAFGGATIDLESQAVPTFSLDEFVSDQIAFLVSGEGTSINTNIPAGTLLDASGKNSTLFRIQGGAKQTGEVQLKTSGTGARGIWATGDNTDVKASSGSDFQVLGTDAMSVLVEGGAHVTLDQGTTVSLVGDGAIVGQVDGNEYGLDGTTVTRQGTDAQLINNATLSTTLSNATGFVTQNQGLLINNGNIDFTAGTGNTGVLIKDGRFENHADISVNGVAVSVQGEQAKVDVQDGSIKAIDGTAAILVGQDASLDLVGSGIGKVTASGTAHAVQLDTGAKGLVVDGAFIDMASAGAGSGNGIENKAEVSGIQLTNDTRIDVMDGKGVRTSATLAQTNAGTINVLGAGTGLAFETAAGGGTSNNIDLSDSNGLNINVTGANATGISVKHTGNGDVKSGANVTVAAGGGSAVSLEGVSSFDNSGELVSASTDAPVISLGGVTDMINSGVVAAVDALTSALTFDDQDSALTNSGQVTGVVDLGEGNNTATNASGATITGNLVAAAGNDTVTNSGTVVGDINLGTGSNAVTLNSDSSVVNVNGDTGTDAVTVKGNAAFTKLDGGIGAADTLTFDGATQTLSAAADVDRFETMSLRNASTVTTADLLKMTDTAGGVGKIDIDATSTLALTPGAGEGYALAHTLSGDGVIEAVMGAAEDVFEFAATTGDAFAGTLKAGLGMFDLQGDNTTALTNATLQSDAGNVTTVGDGEQAIGGIAFNGGTVKFNANVPDQTVATSHVVAGNLQAGTGTVQVNVPSPYIVPPVIPAGSLSLLQQDDVQDGVQLVAADSVSGTGGALVLQDQNGNVITDAKTLDVSQGGENVAVATYDFGLNTGVNSDGLYVGYRLQELDLQADKTLTLTEGAVATAAASDMSAKITGSGNLAIDTANTISLSNSTNDYTGSTNVNRGGLRLDADNVMGNTSALNIATGAKVDMNGKVQTVGVLAGQTGSVLDINSGTLTLANGGISNGVLTGAGSLILAAGDLTVTGANSGLSANTSIASGANVTLDNAAGLGKGSIATDGSLTLSGALGTLQNTLTGAGKVIAQSVSDVVLGNNNSEFAGEFDIDGSSSLTALTADSLGTASVHNEGNLTLDTASDWALKNAVTGAGSLTKQGQGTVTLDDTAAYTGATQVNAGNLFFGSESAPMTLASSQVNVASGAQFGGFGGVAGSIDNAGTLLVGNTLPGTTSAHTFTVGGNLNNNGWVILGGADAASSAARANTPFGNTLDIKGDLSGAGNFAMNTQLGILAGDLIKVGGDTSGSHQILVADSGVEPVSTDGKLTLVETQGGNGNFALAGGHVDAGAFRYTLGKEGQNWVLSTPSGSVPPIDPNVPVDPTEPVTPPAPPPAPGPGDLSGGGNAAVAAHTASASLWSAQMNALVKRLGELRMGKDEGGIWTRAIGKEFKVDEKSSRAYDQNITGMEVGADKAIHVDSGKVYVGGMVGTARSDMNYGEGGTGDVKSQFGGVYATYIGDNGVYVDTVAKYSHFDNDIKTLSNTGEAVKGSYDTNGLGVDVEVGKHIKLKDGWFVEPQLEITATKTQGGKYTSSNGMRVKADDLDSLQSRVGGLFGRSIQMENGMKVQPYAKVSYVTEHGGDSAVKVNGIKLDAQLPGSRTEVGFGGILQLTENSKVSLDAEYAKGDDIEQPYGITLGYRYLW
jgi:autotransporter family porin